MNIFTRLKHWQIFLIYLSAKTLHFIFTRIYLNNEVMLFELLKTLSGILGGIVILLWIHSIGLLLNKQPSNPHHFKNSMLILSSVFCILGYSNLRLQFIIGKEAFIFGLFFFPFMILALIYLLFTVSRSLKSYEDGTKANHIDGIHYAISLLIMPIGVWIIQPKINKIYQESKKNLSK